MNKYIYAECLNEFWPEIKVLMAMSYNDAIAKLAQKYSNKFDDDKILNFDDDFLVLRDYLNDKYMLALSDLEIYEEI